MSDHHGKEFLGFGTTTPAYLLPEAVYQRMFFPAMLVDEHGYPEMAPYGMRKIEASLMDAGLTPASSTRATTSTCRARRRSS